jgi:hypothetical protein
VILAVGVTDVGGIIEGAIFQQFFRISKESGWVMQM